MTGGTVAVVANPHARGDAAGLVDQVVAVVSAGGARAVVLRSAPADAADPVPGLDDLWERDDLETVVAVGGDGTARTVAETMARLGGLWPDGAPDDAVPGGPALVIVPGGTGNSVYRELWADLGWREMLEAVVAGRTRRRGVDLCRIVEADTAVLLGASTGFFRWTLDATARFPELAGRELYLAAGAAAAEELDAYRGSVEVDGVAIATGPIMLAAVGGAPRRSGTIHILPGAEIDDGLLDVCVLSVATREDFFGLMARAAEGTHVGEPGAFFARGRRVVLDCDVGELPFEHDGEVPALASSTVTLEVVAHAVAVLAPTSENDPASSSGLEN